MFARLTSPALGKLIGFGGAVLITVVFFAIGSSVPVAVPALLLLLPVALSSALAGWRVGVLVAVVAVTLYALAFLPPVGVVRIGLTQEVFLLATFVGVALVVGMLAVRVKAPAQLDEERAMLLRSVSHDLRAPLNTIKVLSTDLLDRYGGESADGDAVIGLVVDEADRLDRIVGNLLSYSRVRAGTFAPELEQVAPEQLLRVCAARVGRLGSGRVMCRPEPDLPDVLADPVQVDQVLTNLAENGLRHSPEGTEVTLGARRSGRSVELSVRDRGPGLPAELLAGEWTGVHPEAGTAGLGLTVCKAIVEAHGGRISATAPATGGTLVTFTLPIAP